MSIPSELEFRLLGPQLSAPLGKFFQTLIEKGEDREFHPHPLTLEHAELLCSYSGPDLYYAVTEGDMVIGYGMLRGWEKGFDVPSLGIAIHSSLRGLGVGRCFMHFLHLAAARKGAKRIRLKVYAHNTRALSLYKNLGYRFESVENDQHVGILDLI